MLSYGMDGAAGYMLGAAGYMVVAHVIIVSAQVLLVLNLGLWTLDLGLTIDAPKMLPLFSALLRALCALYLEHFHLSSSS